MRNLTLFTTILLIIAVSMIIGNRRMSQAHAAPVVSASASERVSSPLLPDTLSVAPEPASPAPASSSTTLNVPHIGSVQVLNGCGVTGAADRMADFLRSKNFDVKDIGNAPTWNYPSSMIIARNADMGLANEIEKTLKTGKVTLMRNRDGHLYDVTVIVGPDYESKIK